MKGFFVCFCLFLVAPSATNGWSDPPEADLQENARESVRSAHGFPTAFPVLEMLSPFFTKERDLRPPLRRTTPVRSMLSLYIEELIVRESQGDARKKILDANGEFSYGCLQFQKPTFLQTGKRYGFIPQDMTKVEPTIYDCALQKKLATKLLKDHPSYWVLWENSARKIRRELGLSPPGARVPLGGGTGR